MFSWNLFNTLLLIFFNSSSSTLIFNRNVHYFSQFPLESHYFHNKNGNGNISQRKYLFINNLSHLSPCSVKLFASDKSFETEVEGLYTGLKDKKWSFSDLQKRLTDSGITLDGCNKPDDVIRRVAELSLLGKEALERKLQEENPEFQAEYTTLLTSFQSEYESLAKKERKEFINSLVDRLEKYEAKVPKNAADDDIIDLTARTQSKHKLLHKLPQPVNSGVRTVEAYKSEADNIFNIYNKVKHDNYLKKHLLDEMKNELILSSVDFEDCKTDEDLINRLSYSRVFPKQPNPTVNKKRAKKFLRRNPLDSIFNFSHDFSNFSHDFSNLSQLFNNQSELDQMGFDEESGFDESRLEDSDGISLGMSGFEKEFENSLFDFGMGNDMFDGMNFNGFSIFKDIASMFGINPKKFSQKSNPNQKSQLRFNKQSGSTNTSTNGSTNVSTDGFTEGSNEEESSDVLNHIETDPSLILLQQKAKGTGDLKLQNILNKAIQDPGLRDVLKMAATKGYEEAREHCNGNVKALYILEKLNDKHIWS